MRFLSLTLLMCAFLFAACARKPLSEFGLDGSPIRYETKHFSDPTVLAEVDGQVFTKQQILDKSPVVKDLDQQLDEALIGLAYIKLVQGKQAATKSKLDVFLPETKTPIAQILAKFGQTPAPEIELHFVQGNDRNLIASYESQNFSRDDVDKNHAILQGIEQRRYQETAAQLNGQVSRVLLNNAAVKKNVSLQDFIRKEVLEGREVQVNEEELQAYVKTIGLAEKELTPELRPRFTDSLRVRKEQRAIEDYVAKNILKGPVAVAFEDPRSQITLDPDLHPVFGYTDAAVPLIAMSGITCGDCLQAIESIDRIMNDHKGHLKLFWIHNFNGDDGVARMLAEAAMCSETLKPQTTLAFVKHFSARNVTIDDTSLYGWAKSAGLNEEKFKSCFTAHQSQKALDQNLAFAKKLGIVANPTLWIDGHSVQGVVQHGVAESIVKERISARGSTWFHAAWLRLRGVF